MRGMARVRFEKFLVGRRRLPSDNDWCMTQEVQYNRTTNLLDAQQRSTDVSSTRDCLYATKSGEHVREVCVSYVFLYTKRHVGRRGQISGSYIFSQNIDPDTTGTSSGSYCDFEKI